MTPELPDDPEAEQVQAWAELAELSQDPDFRASLRRMARDEAAERGRRRAPRSCAVAWSRSSATRRAGPSTPASSRTRRRPIPVVAALTAHYAQILVPPRRRRAPASAARRGWSAVNDPRRERYLTLLAVINGWPAPESLAPVLDWSTRALSALVSS